MACVSWQGRRVCACRERDQGMRVWQLAHALSRRERIKHIREKGKRRAAASREGTADSVGKLSSIGVEGSVQGKSKGGGADGGR